MSYCALRISGCKDYSFKAFKNYFVSGIKSALTIEQYAEQGVYFNLFVSKTPVEYR